MRQLIATFYITVPDEEPLPKALTRLATMLQQLSFDPKVEGTLVWTGVFRGELTGSVQIQEVIL